MKDSDVLNVFEFLLKNIQEKDYGTAESRLEEEISKLKAKQEPIPKNITYTPTRSRTHASSFISPVPAIEVIQTVDDNQNETETETEPEPAVEQEEIEGDGEEITQTEKKKPPTPPARPDRMSMHPVAESVDPNCLISVPNIESESGGRRRSVVERKNVELILSEVVQTERDYVRDLQIVIEVIFFFGLNNN